MIRVVLFILLLVPDSSPAQSAEYITPVEHQIRLSGTFGELRSGHFHTGIDIKAEKGVSGDPVRAVNGGIVRRLSVSSGGYGNAVYIEHPDGLTSVYAHLETFSPNLQAVVRTEQEQSESFEVNLEVKDTLIKVLQGAILGTMGNSGHSFGPHLHFELRKTATGKPVNPLPYWSVVDQQRPLLRKVVAYHIDHRGRLGARTELPLDRDTLEVDAWRIGIAVDAIDLFNGGRNKNGIYSLQILVNDESAFELRFDTLSLDDIDFRSHVQRVALESKGLARLHRCFVLGQSAPTFSSLPGDAGIIPLFLDRTTKIKIKIADLIGNTTEKVYHLSRTPSISPPKKVASSELVQKGTRDTIVFGDARILFDSLSLFHDIYLRIDSTPVTSCEASLRMRTTNPVLKKGAMIQFDVDPSETNLLLSRWSGDVETAPQFYPSGRLEHTLSAKIWDLTTFCLIRDTITPEITYLGLNRRSQHTEYKVKLYDNIEGIPWSIRCELNGHWILHTYDAKTSIVRCQVPYDKASGKRNTLEIQVTDAAGNTQVLRKQIE